MCLTKKNCTEKKTKENDVDKTNDKISQSHICKDYLNIEKNKTKTKIWLTHSFPEFFFFCCCTKKMYLKIMPFAVLCELFCLFINPISQNTLEFKKHTHIYRDNSFEFEILNSKILLVFFFVPFFSKVSKNKFLLKLIFFYIF